MMIVDFRKDDGRRNQKVIGELQRQKIFCDPKESEFSERSSSI
jgi:hypothetical protein